MDIPALFLVLFYGFAVLFKAYEVVHAGSPTTPREKTCRYQ
jgi:hypothetical protein